MLRAKHNDSPIINPVQREETPVVDLDDNAKRLIAEGGKIWQKPGITRVYLTDAQLLAKADIMANAENRSGYGKISNPNAYVSKADVRKALGTTANYYQV